MKSAIFYPLFFLLLLSTACEEKGSDVTTFILVRHAEKADDGGEDPPLTAEGESRARRLAYMLKDTPLQAIYTTNFRRTRSTAQPLAEIRSLEVQLYEPYKPDVIAQMVQQHKGGTVVLTGHSNNIPWTANLLLGREVYKDYAESQYGILLIVTVGATNEGTTVTRLNY